MSKLCDFESQNFLDNQKSSSCAGINLFLQLHSMGKLDCCYMKHNDLHGLENKLQNDIIL